MTRNKYVNIDYLVDWFAREFDDSDTAKDISRYIPGALVAMTKKDKALFIAAMINDADTVRALIDDGANFRIYSDLILVYVSTEGNVDIILELIDRGADVQTYKSSSLLGAIINGKREAAKILVEHGALITADALFMVARDNKVDIMRDLLMHETSTDDSPTVSADDGADDATPTLDLSSTQPIRSIYNRAIMIAGVRGHIEIFKMLMDKIKDMIDETTLSIVIASGDRRVTAELLLRGVDLRPGFKDNADLPYIAARHGIFSVTKKLIARDDIFAMNAHDHYIIRVALYYGDLNDIESMIIHGARIKNPAHTFKVFGNLLLGSKIVFNSLTTDDVRSVIDACPEYLDYVKNWDSVLCYLVQN